MGLKSRGSREHRAKKKNRKHGAKESNVSRRFWALYQRCSHDSQDFSSARFARLISWHLFCISTSSKPHVFTCPHLLIFQKFREQCKFKKSRGLQGPGWRQKRFRYTKLIWGVVIKKTLGAGSWGSNFEGSGEWETPPPHIEKSICQGREYSGI